ncbi:TlpA family protein disulfide reductase [Catellatospora sichuanensis]|uniref:TlpA family protein disulfide reductase n=1 Tax=Catellatospora sichuanensis TaxID=1969805 RepID=UPI001FE6C8D9|nr:TlpA disulfide reductase family protein [Catellatospora sichuanensis]
MTSRSRSHRRRSVLALAVAGLATTTLAACGDGEKPPAVGDVLRFPVAERKAAPAVTGELLDGGLYDMAAERGSVVVVNFWASSCPPCRLEAADLEQVAKDTAASGVIFLGINTRDGRDTAKAFVAVRNSYPSIFDPGGRLSLRFTDIPPVSIPATLIIDRQGRVAAVLRKATTAAELGPIVREIATEQAG